MGEEIDVVFVKGSGWDMSTIEPEGFTGLNLHPLQKLRGLDALSAEEMDNQLKTHRISAEAPAPSVEALLHAFLPHKYVDHTHADSILVLTNQKHGEEIVKEALGAKVAVLPYIMSGLPLAKAVIDAYERDPEIDAIVIMNHGIFTFARDARTSYKNMIAYVSRAEAYIEARAGDKPLMTFPENLRLPENFESALIRCAQIIRGACTRPDSDGKTRRFHVETRIVPDLIEASLSEEAQAICRSGVLTPDHAIRTKNAMAYIESVPENDDDLRAVVNRAVETFKADYHRYFHEHAGVRGIDRTEPDVYPLLFLLPVSD